MKLTGFGKLFITVVVLGVLSYAAWHWKSADIKKWAGAEKPVPVADAKPGQGSDFDGLRNAPPDPERGNCLLYTSDAADE